MLTTAIPAVFFPEDALHYSPDDLAFMRRTFRRACDEHPEETETEKQRDLLQRDLLAKAIFSRYQRGLSERELVTAALWTLH
jgi:hypothetical protein